MENSLKIADESDIHYSRQRFKNRVFTQIVRFVTERCEEEHFSRKELADALQKDAGQITRLLTKPSNLTLETISDLLTLFDAEMDTRIVRFKDRAPANYMHPLMERLVDAPRRELVELTTGSLSDADRARLRARRQKPASAPTSQVELELELEHV